MSHVTTAPNPTTATDFTSIAGIVTRGRRAEPPALADGLLNAADPKPNADFIFVRLFRVIGRVRHRANKQGEALLVFKGDDVCLEVIRWEGVES